MDIQAMNWFAYSTGIALLVCGIVFSMMPMTIGGIMIIAVGGVLTFYRRL